MGCVNIPSASSCRVNLKVRTLLLAHKQLHLGRLTKIAEEICALTFNYTRSRCQKVENEF
jgi:hypothetical protein